MSIGGSGPTPAPRLSLVDRIALDRELSDRHRKWGHECPATDIDFLLNEYNHGIPVAIIDYKHYLANPSKTNNKSYVACGCRTGHPRHATWVYSCISPSSRSRRRR